jgi:multiple sugar transport system permease protein
VAAVATQPRELAPARALSGRRLTRQVLTHALMILLSVIMIVPFVVMITTSFMTLGQAYSFPPSLVPRPLHWQNYSEVLQLRPFGHYFFNSAVVAVCITAARLVSCSLAAYAFARLRFPFRNALFYVYLSTLMIPDHVTLIPLFLIMHVLNWVDTYQGLMVPFFVNAFGVFLLRQFFLSIPRELEEAAILDGCGSFGVYWRIIIPLSAPGLASLAILTFVGAWNMFVWPLIVTNHDAMRTIVVGIGLFTGDSNRIANWPYIMAVSTLAVVPLLVIFLFGQRSFVQGITLTGLKG